MKNELKLGIMIPLLIIVLGTILLIYMVAVENEPGALPLVLILTGILILIIKRYRKLKSLQNK